MEICIRITDLPVTVPGFSAADADGFISIYITARLSKEDQLKALVHELKHIASDDFYNDTPIEDVERNAG